MKVPISIPSHRCAPYSDMVRVNIRHYKRMCQLADEGGYASLGQLLNALLDAALPRVKLIERPQYDIVIADSDEDADE